RAIPRAQTAASSRRPLELWVDSFPVVSETFVANEARALQALGHSMRVVATRRPERPAIGLHDVAVTYLEDFTPLERARALTQIAARHPLHCAADVFARLRWRREEAVLPLRELAPAILALE